MMYCVPLTCDGHSCMLACETKEGLKHVTKEITGERFNEELIFTLPLTAKQEAMKLL